MLRQQEDSKKTLPLPTLSDETELDNPKPIYKKLLSREEKSLPSELHPYIIDQNDLVIDWGSQSPNIISDKNSVIRSSSLKTSQGPIPVIIKTIKPLFSSRMDMEKAFVKANKTIIAEAQMMHLLKSSSYTTTLLGILYYNDKKIIGSSISIIMPLYPYTFTHFLTDSAYISLLDKIKLARDITLGLEYIHNYIIHRDFKGPNIFIDKHNKIKIGDFGSAITPDQQNKKKSVAGTYQWMAPELLTEKVSYTKKTDIYSLGGVFYEIAMQQIPFFGLDSKTIENNKCERKHAIIPNDCPPLLKDLISACWENNPSSRPTTQFMTIILNTALTMSESELEKATLSSTTAKLKEIKSQTSVEPALLLPQKNMSNLSQKPKLNPNDEEKNNPIETTYKTVSSQLKEKPFSLLHQVPTLTIFSLFHRKIVSSKENTLHEKATDQKSSVAIGNTAYSRLKRNCPPCLIL